MYIYCRLRRGGAIAGEEDVKGQAKDFLIGIPGNYIAATASPSHKLRNIIRNIYYVYIFVGGKEEGRGQENGEGRVS